MHPSGTAAAQWRCPNVEPAVKIGQNIVKAGGYVRAGNRKLPVGVGLSVAVLCRIRGVQHVPAPISFQAKALFKNTHWHKLDVVTKHRARPVAQGGVQFCGIHFVSFDKIFNEEGISDFFLIIFR